MIKIASFLVLGLFLQNTCFSQTEKGMDSLSLVRAECRLIAEEFSNDKISKAFERLRGIWILPKDELDFIEKKSIEQLNLVEDRYGKSIKVVQAKEDLIEDILYRVTYVVKYERHGLRLRFIFYNGKDNKWYLNNFKWDDSLSLLFDE